jgi:amino acid adenylation domain-containing protein
VLLRAIVAQPTAALHTLPLLTEAEQQQLQAWNATDTAYPQDQTIVSLFEAQVARTPENTAVVFEDQSLTYAALNARANQLAHLLIQQGVVADTLVGICVERSLEMVIGLLAILKAGGAYVPLDPRYPAERLAFMVQDSQVTLLLTQTHLQGSLPITDLNPLPLLVCVDDPLLAAGQPEDNPPPRSQPQDLAYVIYTSGSTGKPKGAINSHAGICNRLQWMQAQYQLNTNDRILQKTPFSFDVSVWEFFWPLLTGSRLVVAIPGGHQDPIYLHQTIAQQGITTLHFVPSMLRAFLEASTDVMFPHLRRIICSGEALPTDVQQACLTRFPSVELHNLYGPTEAAVDVTYCQCHLDSPYLTVPIGRPIANTRIYILDQHLLPTPPSIPSAIENSVFIF